MHEPSPYQSPNIYVAEAKRAPVGRPPLWWLFLLYCAYMMLIYGLVVAMGIAFVVFAERFPADERGQMLITGISMVPMSVVFFLAYGCGFFLPRRRWAWTASLVMICIGLTSPCTWPFSIPLLINWLKPETKEYFP